MKHKMKQEDLDVLLKIFTEQSMATAAHCGIRNGEPMENWLKLCELCYETMRRFDQRQQGRPSATWGSAAAGATARDKTH